jgi:hypothetical protein
VVGRRFQQLSEQATLVGHAKTLGVHLVEQRFSVVRHG